MMEQAHEADTNPENLGDGSDDEQGIMPVEEIRRMSVKDGHMSIPRKDERIRLMSG